LAVLAGVALTLASSVAAERNDWYRNARVWIHCDNHGGLLGQGLGSDVLTAMFGTMPCDLIQVSAQSNGFATYLAKVGTVNPQGQGYDTLAVFKEVTSRLGRRLGVYLSVDRRPAEIRDHPDWAAREADGSISVSGEPIVCQKPNRQQQGYLYERFIPQIREIIAGYDPDALWFDGDYILLRPCWCARCLAEWRADTGLEAPRAKEAAEWGRWVDWHMGRYLEYRRLVAVAIHQASPKALYTSNWSWAWTPEPVPDFADTLSGDVWSVRQVHSVVQRWGGQSRTPWDVMSYCAPASRTFAGYSLQRTLQEGALTLAYGGRWCLWPVAADVPPAGIEMARFAAEFARDRAALTGASVSLSQVAVLDSETALAQGYFAGMDGPVHLLARTLAEAGFCTDLVNEATWRRHEAPYEVVVVAGYPVLDPETLADLGHFAEHGGTVLVIGRALRPAEGAESVPVATLLGLSRHSAPATPAVPSLNLNGRRYACAWRWSAELADATPLATFADGTPALTVRVAGEGRIACLLSDDISYPDSTFLADLLATLGKGPSYTLQGAADAAVICTLRKLGDDSVLHLVDLTARVQGRGVDVDTQEETQWNPLRTTTIRLACAAPPAAATALPAGVRLQSRHEKGVLELDVGSWQTHAAIRLAGPGRYALQAPQTPAPSLEAAFHPERFRAGIVFGDDFETAPLGSAPAAPWQSWTKYETSVALVASPPGAMGQCVCFQDREKSSFWPFMHRSVPAFRRGVARLGFDLRLEAEAACLVEVRYENVAPGVSLLCRDGKVAASGGAPVPGAAAGDWQHVTVELRLGTERASYDVTITAAGGKIVSCKDVPFADSRFTLCNSVYFVGSGEKQASFWLDNVRFERLPEAP
jgi:hypothetical protein